jgi:hypothetical protein
MVFTAVSGYDEPIGDVSTGMRTTAGTGLLRRPVPDHRKCPQAGDLHYFRRPAPGHRLAAHGPDLPGTTDTSI